MASIRKYPAKRSKSGYLWRVQYRDPAGISRTKSGFRTKDEASRWAADNTTSLHAGTWINPTLRKATVGTVGARWLAAQTHLKPSTRLFTEQVWRLYVEPRWGAVPLGNILPSQVQEWISTMDKSPSTVRHAHNQLAQILDAAMRDRMIHSNPARGVTLPRRSKPEQIFWTIQELSWLADEAEAHNPHYGALVWLLGTSGPRWGEAAALRPMDLQPLRNRVSINRNAVKVGSEIIIGTPKTHEKRTIAVASTVMDKLMAVAEGKAGDELLWPGKKGGPMSSPGKGTWFDGAMKRAMEKHEGLQRVTPHGLRHVAAGLLVESGASVKAVQSQLGHSSAAMTLDTYSAIFDDGLDVVASALDANVVGLSSHSPTKDETRRSGELSG